MRQLPIIKPIAPIATIALSLLCSLAFAQTGAPVKGIIVQGGREAIGPKQDDPRAMQASDCTENPVEQGNKPGAGTNDPAARGIVVQGGLEAIGPKQDDPRSAAAGTTAARAIGPKQDDPRAKAMNCTRRKAKI
jgi:hypothetical protein